MSLHPTYLGPSTATDAGLRLVGEWLPDDAEAALFEGRFQDGPVAAAMLLALGDVVQARHHVPAAMLARILAEADPVITIGNGVLRFEGFSACCSAYARVDVAPGGFDATTAHFGTTNVDFGPDLRVALARLRLRGGWELSVRPEGLALNHGEGPVEQPRIALPERWLRGFQATALVEHGLSERGRMGRVPAQRVVASLPRTASSRHAQWLVPAPSGYRVSSQAHPAGLRVAGPSRLRALTPLLRHADEVVLYASDDGGTTAWVLSAGPLRFTLLLTAEVWRGFSGEGAGLSEAARAEPHDVARWRGALRWQPRLVDDGGTTSADRAALAELAGQGLVGFDVSTRSWFHRELPFDAAASERRSPRRRGARRLLEQGRVILDDDGAGATVRGRSASYRVALAPDPTCTCRWHAATGGSRGPCTHVLAAQQLAEGERA